MDFPRCGEIYPVNFDPTIGHETKKARPALIITNDINNEYSPVVTVIPLSGNVIYELTKDFPKYEIYGITNQLRRAAVSIPSNIAEGSSRSSSKDRKRFYEIARSSVVEIDTQLEISKELNYFNSQSESKILQIEDTMNSLFAMLTKLKERTK